MRAHKTYLDITVATVGLLLLQALCLPPAPAQADWLQTGKDLLGTVGSAPQVPAAGLTSQDLASGLKDALRVGTETVVGQLGRLDGFNADPAIHIPLPESLRQVKSALGAVGMSAHAGRPGAQAEPRCGRGHPGRQAALLERHRVDDPGGRQGDLQRPE